MSAVTLYELADARAILDEWLLESEGELTAEIEALLAELSGAADEKIERVALYVREQKALASAAKEERDRLSGIVARRLKAAESLTLYLQREMERLGKLKVNGVLATVSIQKNPPAVRGELSPEALEIIYHNGPAIVKHIPESFMLDRKACLDAYKAGQPLPGGLTVEQTSSIRIR